MRKQPRDNSARLIGALLIVSASAIVIGSFFTAVDLVSKNGAESEQGIGAALSGLVAASAFIFCAVKLLEAARGSHQSQSDDNEAEPSATEKASDNNARTDDAGS